MKVDHVRIEQDGDGFVGTVLDRRGISTQCRTLDEQVFIVRDAIALAWEETDVHLELVLAPEIEKIERDGAWSEIVANSVGQSSGTA